MFHYMLKRLRLRLLAEWLLLCVVGLSHRHQARLPWRLSRVYKTLNPLLSHGTIHCAKQTLNSDFMILRSLRYKLRMSRRRSTRNRSSAENFRFFTCFTAEAINCRLESQMEIFSLWRIKKGNRLLNIKVSPDRRHPASLALKPNHGPRRSALIHCDCRMSVECFFSFASQTRIASPPPTLFTDIPLQPI